MDQRNLGRPSRYTDEERHYIGVRLRSLRHYHNLTLADVAAVIGCSQATLSPIETGKELHNPILMKLLTLYEISIDELLDSDNDTIREWSITKLPKSVVDAKIEGTQKILSDLDLANRDSKQEFGRSLRSIDEAIKKKFRDPKREPAKYLFETLVSVVYNQAQKKREEGAEQVKTGQINANNIAIVLHKIEESEAYERVAEKVRFALKDMFEEFEQELRTINSKYENVD